MFQEGTPAVKVAVAPIKSPCAKIAGCAGVLVPGFCGYSFLVLAVEGLIGFGLGVLEVKGLPLNFCLLKNTCWNTNIMVLLRLACQVSPECFCFILKALTAYMFEISFISKIITDTSIWCCNLHIQRSFNVSKTWHWFGVGPLESCAMCAMLLMFYLCRPGCPSCSETWRKRPTGTTWSGSFSGIMLGWRSSVLDTWLMQCTWFPSLYLAFVFWRRQMITR